MLAGKFQVVRTLGAGGMGAVYEVEHTLTKHRRALKLLHRELIYFGLASTSLDYTFLGSLQ